MFTCLLITRWLVIDSFINGCDEFEILLILVFFLKLLVFSIFVPISYIGTVFLYRLSCFHLLCYHLLVSTCHLTCYYLPSAPCYVITYYLPPVLLTPDLWSPHLREFCTCYYMHTMLTHANIYTCSHYGRKVHFVKFCYDRLNLATRMFEFEILIPKDPKGFGYENPYKLYLM